MHTHFVYSTVISFETIQKPPQSTLLKPDSGLKLYKTYHLAPAVIIRLASQLSKLKFTLTLKNKHLCLWFCKRKAMPIPYFPPLFSNGLIKVPCLILLSVLAHAWERTSPRAAAILKLKRCTAEKVPWKYNLLHSMKINKQGHPNFQLVLGQNAGNG